MHDELVFEMPEDKLAEYIPQLNDIMCLKDTLQGMLEWPVPLTTDAEYGDSWHVDHDFFKEHPELKDMKAPIVFHQGTQVTEPVPQEPPVKVEEKKEESPKAEVLLNAPITMELLPDINMVADAPLLTPDSAAPATEEESIDEMVFTISNTSKTNLLRINQVITFLTEMSDYNKFDGKTKILKLVDKDGYVLTVSNIRVNSTAFYTLAYFLGI